MCNKKETNVYDMRVTLHEDGWIYGPMCYVNVIHRDSLMKDLIKKLLQA